MSSYVADLQQDAVLSRFAEQVAAAERVPSVMVRTAPAGCMPPLHRRHEPETYRVVSGAVTFFIGSEVVHAGPGDVVVCPAGSPRSFLVEHEDTSWQVLTHVRSLERFADFGRAVARPLCDPSAGWPCEAELTSVAGLAAANGIELLGPPGARPS